eukprot:10474180-Karenia_brevis.AAC.1
MTLGVMARVRCSHCTTPDPSVLPAKDLLSFDSCQKGAEFPLLPHGEPLRQLLGATATAGTL